MNKNLRAISAPFLAAIVMVFVLGVPLVHEDPTLVTNPSWENIKSKFTTR